MASIFSKIVAGEIPSYKIAEDEHFFAFLDIHPLMPGHTLVIPKKETDYLFDIDDRELAAMIVFAKKIALALKTAIPCKRIGMAVVGMEVPHAHIHLIPINKETDMLFSKPKLNPTAEEMKAIAEKISNSLR
ncbi:MAG: HIT family protein [Bacteroidales bacterium]|jgi:histidine triad (HIT) family protein|nr:HIT family protein [Bacteroidales bacterium]OQC03725.1 MAG: HIT-like protein [Bacteroidetes bacterium ADurb.Bin090]MBP8981909.1 HIT family protein [Bacteroidales bacterium]NLV38092.1 HIT family protein [Bacteroidales bacterium]HNZ80434.1 HIT family protein [Bacteroidales bacterium]